MPGTEIVEGTVTPAPQTAVIEEPSAVAQAEAAEANWYDGELGEGVELTDKDREYKTLGAYIQGSQNMRGMIDKKGMIDPGKDATPEDIKAFRDALPEYLRGNSVEVPDAYEIEAISSRTDLTDERKAGIYDGLKASGLSNEMAKGVFEMFGKEMEEDKRLMTENAATERAESEATLKDELGDKYPAYADGVNRVGAQFPEAMELLKTFGLDGNIAFYRMFGEVAKGTREDGVHTDTLSSADIDDQISAVKSDPKYRDGNQFERKALIDKLDGLYARKQQARA